MRARAWVLMALLAGCGGTGGAGSTTGTTADPALAATRCHTGQLRARIESATATTTVVSLTNTGTVACALEGYVRLELLDGAGAVLPVQPARLADVPSRRVTVTPGRTASFELRTRSTAAGGAPCTVVTPVRLRITPPDESEALNVDVGGATGVAGCDSQYGVTAMTPGL